MKEHRLSKRYNSDKVCLLELGNEFYPAKLKNISFGGALVFTPNMQHGLSIADKCTICMNGEFSREYSCKVIRVESCQVALEFIKWY